MSAIPFHNNPVTEQELWFDLEQAIAVRDPNWRTNTEDCLMNLGHAWEDIMVEESLMYRGGE